MWPINKPEFKRKIKKPPKRLLLFLFTEPIFIEITKRNGVLNRVIYVTHNSNGFKVEQSGTQTITDLSGIRCLSRNRVLVKNFFEFKKFREEASGKTVFHLETPGGRKDIVSSHPQHIHIFNIHPQHIYISQL